MHESRQVHKSGVPWLLGLWGHPCLPAYLLAIALLQADASCQYATGEVTEKHTQKATIESKGKQITKNGEPDNPAFKVERKGKNPVIKKVWCRYLSWHKMSPYTFPADADYISCTRHQSTSAVRTFFLLLSQLAACGPPKKPLAAVSRMMCTVHAF